MSLYVFGSKSSKFFLLIKREYLEGFCAQHWIMNLDRSISGPQSQTKTALSITGSNVATF